VLLHVLFPHRAVNGIYKPFQLAYHNYLYCEPKLLRVSEKGLPSTLVGPTISRACMQSISGWPTYGACHFSIKESVPGDVFSSDHSHIKSQVYSIRYCDMTIIISEYSSVNT
jgi:hypothetical protein